MSKNSIQCENCAFYNYDEFYEQYFCDVNMDEDDVARMSQLGTNSCPYYNDGNEYKLAAKQ